MAKIYAPNKGYAGKSAGVSFINGVGETKDEWLIQWFERKGYRVEKRKPRAEVKNNARSGKDKKSNRRG